MKRLSGKQFLECYNRAAAWMPGTPRPEHPLHDAFSLYDHSPPCGEMESRALPVTLKSCRITCRKADSA
ncbi:hypothetical protein FMM82_05065 [[Clostridium] clostridioforme]|nr:hypothetical protein [Enterocloster clostridioformis]